MFPFLHSDSESERKLRQQCEEIFAAHSACLLACAEKYTDDASDVDLLLSRVLRKVVRVYCHRPMAAELLIRYTLRSIRNAAHDMRRRNIRRKSAEQRFGQEELLRHQLQHCEPQDTELLQALRRAVQQLPEPGARVLLLRIWQGLSFAEIARQTGLTESTARRRYEEAIENIRMMIDSP